MLDKFIIGKAGEHLVCGDLLLQGYKAYLAPSDLSKYDIIVDLGTRFIKIQVKSVSNCIANTHYNFRIRKTNHAKYTEEEVDVFAFAMLDTKQIAYIANKDIISDFIMISNKEMNKRKHKQFIINTLTFDRAL